MAGVQQHLKENATDCLFWASRVTRSLDSELPLAIPGSFVEWHVIGDEENDRIRNFWLEDSESDRDTSDKVGQSVVAQDSSEEGEDEDDSDTNSTYLGTSRS